MTTVGERQQILICAIAGAGLTALLIEQFEVKFSQGIRRGGKSVFDLLLRYFWPCLLSICGGCGPSQCTDTSHEATRAFQIFTLRQQSGRESDGFILLSSTRWRAALFGKNPPVLSQRRKAKSSTVIQKNSFLKKEKSSLTRIGSRLK